MADKIFKALEVCSEGCLVIFSFLSGERACLREIFWVILGNLVTALWIFLWSWASQIYELHGCVRKFLTFKTYVPLSMSFLRNFIHCWVWFWLLMCLNKGVQYCVWLVHIAPGMSEIDSRCSPSLHFVPMKQGWFWYLVSRLSIWLQLRVEIAKHVVHWHFQLTFNNSSCKSFSFLFPLSLSFPFPFPFPFPPFPSPSFLSPPSCLTPIQADSVHIYKG